MSRFSVFITSKNAMKVAQAKRIVDELTTHYGTDNVSLYAIASNTTTRDQPVNSGFDNAGQRIDELKNSPEYTNRTSIPIILSIENHMQVDFSKKEVQDVCCVVGEFDGLLIRRDSSVDPTKIVRVPWTIFDIVMEATGSSSEECQKNGGFDKLTVGKWIKQLLDPIITNNSVPQFSSDHRIARIQKLFFETLMEVDESIKINDANWMGDARIVAWFNKIFKDEGKEIKQQVVDRNVQMYVPCDSVAKYIFDKLAQVSTN